MGAVGSLTPPAKALASLPVARPFCVFSVALLARGAVLLHDAFICLFIYSGLAILCCFFVYSSFLTRRSPFSGGYD